MEGGLRLFVGLGDPPLTVEHPTIEYLCAPNQDVTRFGNRYYINKHGMRSDDFPEQQETDELRIMIFGDSVLNGGAPTDQEELASSLFKEALEQQRPGDVTVGNISAGSWGPGNWLAYAQEHGFFDADEIMLVLSGHDAADNPTFVPLNPMTHPTRKPWSAIYEAVTRYAIPRFFGKSEHAAMPAAGSSPVAAEDAGENVGLQQGMSDLRSFLEMARVGSRKVTVFYHPERVEFQEGEPHMYKKSLQGLLEEMAVPMVDLTSFYKSSGLSAGELYRDGIHPNAKCQKVIAEAFLSQEQ